MYKKIVINFVVYSMIIICLGGCAFSKKWTKEESKNNFEQYKNSIIEILEEGKYGYQINEDLSDQFGMLIEDIEIEIDENKSISISLMNDYDESDKGAESFAIVYSSLVENETISEVNQKLLTQIFNCISERTVDENFMKQFIESDEEEYAPDKIGRMKTPDEKIAKCAQLDWEGAWIISYSVYHDDFEIIEMAGITKQ